MHGHRRDYGLLLLLGMIWGGSFLFIKMAVADIPPMTVAAIRIVIGGAVLAAVAAPRPGSVGAPASLAAAADHGRLRHHAAVCPDRLGRAISTAGWRRS